jgi:hypothetical protein
MENGLSSNHTTSLLLCDLHLICCGQSGVPRLPDHEHHQAGKFIEINEQLSRAVLDFKVLYDNGAILILFHSAHTPDLWNTVMNADEPA